MPVVINITRSRSLDNDADGDGQPDPGDVFLHTIIIENSGDTDASTVVLEETEQGYVIDPGSVEIGPIAVDDVLTSISGNTPFSFTAAELLGNDLDPDDVTPNLTITQIEGVALVYDSNPSAPIAVTGGTLVHDGDGGFTFTPTTGFTGTAAFSYEATDEQGQTSVAATPGEVSFTVTDPVWYVDSAAAPGGDGSFANPFQSLTELNGVTGDGTTGDDVDNANDTIFIYDRGTDYSGGIVLEAGQKLIGDGHAFNVNGLDIGAGTTNTGIGSTANIVTLSTDNEVRGVDLVGGGNSAVGLTDGGGTVGNLIVSSTNISGLGKAVDIDQGGSLSVDIDSLASASSTSEGIHLQGVSGTFNVDAGLIQTSTGTGVLIGASGGGTAASGGSAVITIGAAITSPGGSLVEVQDRSGGSVTFSGALTEGSIGAGQTGILLDGNAGTITFSGQTFVSAGAGTGNGVTATNNSGTINFSAGGTGLDISTAGGSGLTFTGGGTLNVTGSGNSITTTTGQIVNLGGTIGASGVSFASLTGGTTGSTAINLNSVTGGAFNGGTVNITGTTAGDAVAINNSSSAVNITGGSIGSATGGDTVHIGGGTGAVTIAANLSNSTAGHLVEVDGHSVGAVSLSGTLNSTATSNGILLNNDSGAIGFSGATKTLATTTGGNNAVTITNNNAAVSFTGGNLDIDTTSGTGIAASGSGGTLAIGGTNNTITTTTGRAIGLDGPDSAGITLQSVTVGGGASTTAIYLNNAGSGGFTVTGVASNAASGGTIGSVTGADGSTTAGIGVFVGNTSNVSLSNMSFTGGYDNYAIHGDNVTNFTLRDSTISGTSGSSGSEGNIRFNNLDGVGLFEGNNIAGASADALRIVNTQNETLNLFVRDSTNDQAVFGLNQTNANDIIQVETQNDANAFILVDGVQFTGWRGDAIQTLALGTSNQEVTIRNNSLANGHGNIASGGGIGVLVGGTAGGGTWGVDYTIENNTFTGSVGYALAASFNGNGGTARGYISGNVIGDNDGVAETIGSSQAGGIFVSLENSGGAAGSLSQFVTINNNQVRDIVGAGITVRSVNTGNIGNPTLVEATVTNNVVANMSGSSFAAFWARNGADPGDTTQIGLDLVANNFSTAGPSTNTYGAVYLEQFPGPASYYFPNYGVGPIETYLTGAPRSNVLTGNANQIGDPFPDPVFSPDAVINAGALQPPQTGSNTQLPSGALLAAAPPADPPGDVPEVDTPAPVTGPGGDGGTDPAPSAPPPPALPPHPVIVDDGVLSQAELDWLAEAAIQRWIDAGATPEQVAAMRATAITVTDMNGLYLGASSAGSIRIDSDGAGHGWFLDKSPDEDGEFGGSGSCLSADAGGPAAGRMDLLTVLMHEIGHQLGLADDFNLNSADSLMYGRAHLGERRLPQAEDLVGADLEHAGHESFVLTVPTIATLPAGKAVRVTFNSTVNTFENEVISNPFENYSRISFLLGGPVDSAIETLDVDSLTLGGTIWHDNGAGGGSAGNGLIDGSEAGIDGVTISLFVDADNDNVADLPASPIATTTTAGGGLYSFANLAPGTYLVRVDQANFESGGALEATQISPQTTPEPVDPDDNVDNDDNGSRAAGQAAFSRSITLAYNTEPTPGTGNDTNNTLDLAFLSNAPPELDLNGGDAGIDNAAAYTENDGPLVLSPGALVSDADDTNIESATLTVSGGFQSGFDYLTINGGTSGTIGSISFSYDSFTGVLTLTGSATLADYQAALRQAGFESTSDSAGATRTISWTVNDGDSSSASATTTVNITAVNDAPDGTDATIFVLEDGWRLLAAVDFGFDDPDGGADILSAVIIDGVTGNGQLFFDADGTAGAGVPVAVAPGAFPITYTVADLADGKISYRPDANASGAGVGEISFRVVDSSGALNDTDPVANTLTIDVSPVNDAPEGQSDTITIFEDGIYEFDAIDFGFSDIDGDAFVSITITAAPSVGTLFLDADGPGGAAAVAVTNGATIATAFMDGRFYYVPTADANGLSYDSFDFEVTDDGGTANGGVDTSLVDYTIDLDVTAVNDAPLLGNLDGDNSAFTEDGAPVLLDSGSDASVSDIDSTDFGGGSLTVSVVANGVPAEDLLGIDQSGNVSIAGITVSVGATAIGTITGNGANGNDLVIALNASATPLLVQDLVRALTYANTNLLNPDTTGRSIAITLVDGDGVANGGGDSVLVNVGTAITPVDDAPVAIDDAITVAEDQVATGSLFADNGSGADSDLDGPALQVAAVNGVGADVGAAIALASGALLTVNANGSYSYDPNGMFDYLAAPGSGADNSPATETFTYTLVNGNTATVTVSITGVDGKDLLIGTAGDDTMSGGTNDDRLLGLGGNDTLFGGRDNDRLFGGDGDDWLDGGSGFDELYGGAGNDTLHGGSHGNDRLDGGTGADTMIGGTGHDTYVVDNSGDVVVELGSGGNDKVESAISFNLPTHFEKLILTGSFSHDGRGNSADNEIVGNSGKNFLNGGRGDDLVDGGAGNDRIYGSEGNDTLIGGAGEDRFHFNTAPGPDNVDAIFDFTVGEDLIYLAKYTFTALGEPRTGLSAAAFQAGPTALEADDRILYDQASGQIFYDADGTGAAAAILFATVSAGTLLTHTDFHVYI